MFTSEKELIKEVAKHERRYNNTAKTVLNFKSPNKIVLNTSQSVTYVLTIKNGSF